MHWTYVDTKISAISGPIFTLITGHYIFILFASFNSNKAVSINSWPLPTFVFFQVHSCLISFILSLIIFRLISTSLASSVKLCRHWTIDWKADVIIFIFYHFKKLSETMYFILLLSSVLVDNPLFCFCWLKDTHLL